MAVQPDITLILPAFNEAAGIAGTLSEVVGYFQQAGLRYEVIVAADGDDGTREIVAALARDDPAIRVTGGQARRGKGRSIREAVLISNGAIVGFADADNKVPVSEFEKVRPCFKQGWQVVTGSRRLCDSFIERGQPLYRRLGSRAFAVFMQAVIGLPGIGDSQCGFKFFTREAALELFRRQKIDGYMFDVEILALAQRLGYRIQQVPIRWRDDGNSRFAPLSGSVRNLVEIFKIRLSLAQAGGAKSNPQL